MNPSTKCGRKYIRAFDGSPTVLDWRWASACQAAGKMLVDDNWGGFVPPHPGPPSAESDEEEEENEGAEPARGRASRER